MNIGQKYWTFAHLVLSKLVKQTLYQKNLTGRSKSGRLATVPVTFKTVMQFQN